MAADKALAFMGCPLDQAHLLSQCRHKQPLVNYSLKTPLYFCLIDQSPSYHGAMSVGPSAYQCFEYLLFVTELVNIDWSNTFLVFGTSI